MTLYKGSQRQGQIYKGSRRIGKVYKGSSLIFSYDPYKPGTVILQKSVAGTYQFTLRTKRKVQVIMVGAGGGGAWSRYAATWLRTENGGSGAMLQGTITLAAGTYTVVVGKGGNANAQDWPLYSTPPEAVGGTGGNTTAFNLTAGGGGGAHAMAGLGSTVGYSGAGGTATASSGFTATQGKAGDTVGVYNGYGAGGTGAPTNGKDGYVLIKSI